MPPGTEGLPELQDGSPLGEPLDAAYGEDAAAPPPFQAPRAPIPQPEEPLTPTAVPDALGTGAPAGFDPAAKVSTDQQQGRVGNAPLANPANKPTGGGGMAAMLAKLRGGSGAEDAAKQAVTAASERGGVSGKLAGTAAKHADDAKDIAKLAASGFTNAAAWWSLAKRHWKVVMAVVLVAQIPWIVIGLAIGSILGGQGNATGAVGVNSGSFFSGQIPDLMTDSLNILDPKNPARVKSTLTVSSLEGPFSPERNARITTLAGLKGKTTEQPVGSACIVNGRGEFIDDNSSQNGSSKAVDCLSNSYYNPTVSSSTGGVLIGQTKQKVTDEELRWYMTARWGYTSVKFRVKNNDHSFSAVPGQKPSDYFGRKFVIYNPENGKAAIGIIMEYGPSPHTWKAAGSAQQENLWNTGPTEGRAPRRFDPPGFLGSVGGGPEEMRQALGVKEYGTIKMGFLKPDNYNLPLGMVDVSSRMVSGAPVPAGTSGSKLNRVPIIRQGNYRSVSFPHLPSGNSDCRGGPCTVATSGCNVTSATMVLQFYGVKIEVPEAAKFASTQPSTSRPYRWEDAGVNYDYFSAIAAQHGLKGEIIGRGAGATSAWSKIVSLVRDGKPVIVSGNGYKPFTQNGHFVVFAGLEGDVLTVNDPARGITTYSLKSLFGKPLTSAVLITK